MDRITAIQVFLTVAETGSFTATAERLDLSRPKVTRAVALMEEWFNARLLQRTTRHVSLTDAGEQAVEYCKKMTELTSAIEQDFLTQRGELRGSLRIASNAAFGSTHLLNAIRTFLAKHPKLNIQLILADNTVNLVEEGIDLAVRFTNNPDPNVVARPLFTCHSLLVATPAYLARHGTIHSPQELANHRYLAHANVNRKEWTFIKDEQETVLELTSQLTINDTGALLNFTLADGGIAMLPKYFIEQQLKNNQLQIVLPDWQMPTYQVYAVYPSRRQLPKTVRSFVDFLVEEFEGKGDW
ncbi:putative HTH-type transcriptional regulator [Actinobacillus pleuropneumoniae serovar 3 str. JL03]|uniref:Putative HTH-type transcriptional regulator n=1 Tax=Actinobacillus pleuropneumoniae serotype 3 (strain JL03) TaxID=434271 RepID=B0BQC7_ACTPJ|nr:LysR family transcriptional regulator [Actinobacillus pleuropneumoniae]ABY69762.1 putative HTH-type transcriptional regulator [Actinobacillus pleuropneumoniae serovar 3 str. JL03]UKH14707.1 LysR family transcriptional regulator [Actinobacillus pleuropneumoniae]UKH22878.1 LysR family transcriptional regulator [Actinobacillus pleuropneumoniae]UKH43887.1 LysR family transcriptional regulator [Actinobacillus pleuropneumoniae]USQ15828.1 LysR family transcriptional regulator [Actinobacillus pleur